MLSNAVLSKFLAVINCCLLSVVQDVPDRHSVNITVFSAFCLQNCRSTGLRVTIKIFTSFFEI